MKKAMLGSAFIHFGLIAGAWVVLSGLPRDINDTDAESISVSIVSMEMVSTEPSEVETSSNTSMVSAGAEHEAMEVPEVAEAEPVTVEPIAAAIPEVMNDAATPVADTVAPTQSDPLEPLRAVSISELKPVEPMREAVEKIEEATEAPVPRPRMARKQVEPKVEPAREQPKTKPAPEAKPQKQPASRQASLGYGGNAEADAAASSKSGGGKGSKDDGGSAAASKYPGLVQARVTRAAKYPAKAKGKGGEALVSFVVGAGGSVSGVALSRSSGNAVLDDAAIAAVMRAAPFPPIPEAAGRSSWAFTVPVYFKK